MGKYYSYRIKIDSLYVGLASCNLHDYNFVKNEDEAFLFSTFKQTLKVIRGLHEDERFSRPVTVLIERVEFIY